MNSQHYRILDRVACCDDDKVIIKLMKKLGIWSQVKAQSTPGKTVCFLPSGYLFIWHGAPGDTGYSAYIALKDPLDLLEIAARATGKTKPKDSTAS